MRKIPLVVVAVYVVAACVLFVSFAGAPLAQGFGPADEARDFGVAARSDLRTSEHSAPTPLALPGGRTISTSALRELIANSAADRRPLLIDVLGGQGHATIPDAVWLPDAGRGSTFEDVLQARLSQTLKVLTGGARARTLVFFCQGPHCWLSYNAALRAVKLGYPEVYWYRGGIEAWLAAGGTLIAPRISWERPTAL